MFVNLFIEFGIRIYFLCRIAIYNYIGGMKMSMLPNFFKDAVVGIFSINPKNKEKFCRGTGFLVGDCVNIKETDLSKRLYYVYLITNKHVINNEEIIYVRFNNSNTNSTKDYSIKLIDVTKKNKLYSECDMCNADVVAISINTSVLKNDNSKYSFYSLELHLLKIADMMTHGITEGDFIHTLGFPMNLIGYLKMVPICRMGCIANISELYENNTKNVNFIIDTQTFPGNSGGPVILRPELTSVGGSKKHDTAYLIGILHSYIPYREETISLQTGQTRTIFEENSGLTLVHPVDYIVRTVLLEAKRVRHATSVK